MGGEAAVRIFERHSAHIWVQEALLPDHLRPPRLATLFAVLVTCTHKFAHIVAVIKDSSSALKGALHRHRQLLFELQELKDVKAARS